KQNITHALPAVAAEKSLRFVEYKEEGNSPEETQILKLHEAVGLSILLHKYSDLKLPTKSSTLDWTLGPGVSVLREKTKADYGLFLYLRDSFASGGRVAMMVFGAAMGIGIPGGSQSGFASLIDLRTGDVVWFNRMISASGDLREPDSAAH